MELLHSYEYFLFYFCDLSLYDFCLLLEILIYSKTLLWGDCSEKLLCFSCRHEHEMYRTVISDYEDRQKQLLVENSKMRECLVGLQKDLVAMMRDPNTPAENTSQVWPQHISSDNTS